MEQRADPKEAGMATRSFEKGSTVKIDVHLLITEEDGIFNATCLEMGLAAAGPDLDTVTRDMLELVIVHLRACEEEGHPQDAFVPAPAEYWGRYADAVRRKACRTKKLDMPAPVRPSVRNFLSSLAVRSYVCASP